MLVFRREEAEDSFTVKLPYLDRDKTYVLHLSDESLMETESTASGKQLAEGIPVEFREAPASLRIFYEER